MSNSLAAVHPELIVELQFMNGWYSHAISTDSLRAMGSYSGNIAYCIEPGTGQHTGDTLTEKNEDYFNNLGSNGTISGDDIRLNIGRILQYGYCGSIRGLLSASIILTGRKQTDWLLGNASEGIFERTQIGNV